MEDQQPPGGWSVILEGSEADVRLMAGRLGNEGIQAVIHRVPHLYSINEAGESMFQLLTPSAEAQAATTLVEEEVAEWDDSNWEEAEAAPEGNLSDLADIFDAADRLMHNPWNEGATADLDRAVAAVKSAGPAYGLDPTVWAAAAELGLELLAMIEDQRPTEEVSEGASRLRAGLRPYI